MVVGLLLPGGSQGEVVWSVSARRMSTHPAEIVGTTQHQHGAAVLLNTDVPESPATRPAHSNPSTRQATQANCSPHPSLTTHFRVHFTRSPPHAKNAHHRFC